VSHLDAGQTTDFRRTTPELVIRKTLTIQAEHIALPFTQRQ
jgi:hypothetical protein